MKTLKKLAAILLSISLVVSVSYFGFSAVLDSETSGSISLGVGESYTFNFNEDEVPDYTLNTGAMDDGDGNTFYPFTNQNGNATAVQENIIVTTKADGTQETVGALKYKGLGLTTLIPTDKYGNPLVIDPNAVYTVSAKAFIKEGLVGEQLFFGGGVFGADKEGFHADGALTMTGTTDNGASKNLTNRHQAYRSKSFMYTSKAEAATHFTAASGGKNLFCFDTFDTINPDAVTVNDNYNKYQYYTAERTFTTGAFTENTVNGIGNNTFSLTDTAGNEYAYGAYFSVNFKGNSFIPKYRLDENGNRVATGITENRYTTFYIDSITITKVSQTATVSYDANGGTFADGSTTIAATKENVGSVFSAETPTNGEKVFVGWGYSADSTESFTVVQGDMHGKTVYAIWKELGPHDGEYKTFRRYIDFSNYTRVLGTNSYGYLVNETDSEKTPYYNVIEDSTATGGKYLQYDNIKGCSWWYANWNLTMTETGESTATAASDAAGDTGLVLENGATYRVTLRLRINELKNDNAFIYVLYGTGNACGSYDRNSQGTNTADYSVIKTGLTMTDGKWVDVEALFTVPDTYQTLTKGVANRCYIGVCETGDRVRYDIDTVTLEKVTATNLYVNENGEYTLFDTVYGAPGTDLPVGDESILEFYENDATGGVELVKYNSWYTDNNATEKAILKFGNYDVALYCPDAEANLQSTKNQEIFAGFDSFVAHTDAFTSDVVFLTEEDAYSGETSLKAELSANAYEGFEVRNRSAVDLKNGRTYSISFFYKADKAAELSAVLAKGGVSGDKSILKTVTLSPASDWTDLSLTVTADGAEENSVLAFMLSSEEANNVLIDAISVYSVTAAYDAEKLTCENGEALRLMFSYGGIANNSVTLNGVENEIVERGILVKGADNSAELNLDNKDASGVYHFNTEDMSENWMYDTENGETVYSVYLEGFAQNDDYAVSARGYVKLSGGEMYYTDILTTSVADVPTVTELDTDYFAADAQYVTKQLDKNGVDAVNYIFITDVHYGSNAKQNASLINQMNLITEMANKDDSIDFVVVGGDTTTGMYTTKEACIAATQKALDPLLDCTKPVFVLMGNHDDNSYHTLSSSNPEHYLYKDRLISDYDWSVNIIDRYSNNNGHTVVQDNERDNTKYFYYDLADKKTRVICLDSVDYQAKYDENGNITETAVVNESATREDAKYASACSYKDYSARQVRWLAEDAMQAPDDWDYIFLSHMGIDADTNSGSVTMPYGKEVRKVIAAYNSGETYTASFTDIWGEAVEVNADFAGASGKVLSHQFGHIHVETTVYSEDIDLYQFCTSSSNVGQTKIQTAEAIASSSIINKKHDWRAYTRALGTDTEACFSVMSVSDKRIYRWTVGEGANEKLVYPSK